MDIHIERPTLNAPTAEQNIATIDTWIADTADKLNIALQQSATSTTSTKTTTSAKSSASSSSGSSTSGGNIWLDSGRIEVPKINLED